MFKNFDVQTNQKILIKEKACSKFINMEDVILLTCEGYITKILTTNFRTFKVAKILKKFEEELKDFGFIRANHNTIVNAKHIHTIHGTKKRKLILINDIEVTISRRKYYQFK